MHNVGQKVMYSAGPCMHTRVLCVIRHCFLDELPKAKQKRAEQKHSSASLGLGMACTNNKVRVSKFPATALCMKVALTFAAAFAVSSGQEKVLLSTSAVLLLPVGHQHSKEWNMKLIL